MAAVVTLPEESEELRLAGFPVREGEELQASLPPEVGHSLGRGFRLVSPWPEA